MFNRKLDVWQEGELISPTWFTNETRAFPAESGLANNQLRRASRFISSNIAEVRLSIF